MCRPGGIRGDANSDSIAVYYPPCVDQATCNSSAFLPTCVCSWPVKIQRLLLPLKGFVLFICMHDTWLHDKAYRAQ